MNPVDPQEIAQAVCDREGYVLCGKEGQGSFKATYKVQKADGVLLALKVFLRGTIDSRGEREIKVMMRLDHPSVAKLLGFGSVEIAGQNQYYLIEEYFAGGTLTGRLQQSILSSDDLCQLARPLISGLSHIAANNLVHRDIKPDNILFRDDKRAPVIVDFGVVRDLASASLTPTWMPSGPGTPLFSSPEQLNNEKPLIDWRSDQFSLGLVLAVCLFGRHPYSFPGEVASQIVDRIAQRSPQNPEFRERTIQSGLQQINRMIEPWPVRRYRTTAQLKSVWQA